MFEPTGIALAKLIDRMPSLMVVMPA